MSSERNVETLHKNYYPHIDGIRTLAVLPIVVYHILASLCPGGYVGVDIFFVISGYLITQGILNSSKKGQFSIANFYSKRIRRIIPAYAVLILAVLLSSLFLYAGEGLESILRAARYSGAFVTNVFFYKNSGYFDLDSANNPLLHLWSLGVEEQFYMVIPLLMLLCFRVGIRRSFVVLSVLALASLGLSIFCNIIGADTFNFFLLPTRAWELLAGSLLAYWPPVNSAEEGISFKIYAYLGLLLCVLPFFAYDDATMFPGLMALPPVLGTALLIRYGCFGLIGKLLKSSPFVFVGKISYSLYLWHWPLIVYWNYYSFNSENPWGLASVFLLSLMMAYLSWRYVEMPVRFSTNWSLKRGLIITSLSSVFVISYAVLVVKVPVLARASGIIVTDDGSFYGFKKLPNSTLGDYPKSAGEEEESKALKVLGEDVNPRYVLIGDSHAMHYVSAMNAYSERNQINGLYINRSRLLARHVDVIGKGNTSSERMEAILEWLSRQENIDYVIASSRLNSYIEGANNEPPYMKIVLKHKQKPDLLDSASIMEVGLRQFAHAIKAMGKTLIVLQPSPEQGFDSKAYRQARTYAYKFSPDYTGNIASYADYIKRSQRTNLLLDDMEKEGLITVVDVEDFFFPDKNKLKINGDQGEIIYWDDDHFSVDGSDLVIKHVENRLNQLMKKSTPEK